MAKQQAKQSSNQELDELLGEPLVLTLKTHPFKAVDKNGKVEEYYLQELSGKERDEYFEEWNERFTDTNEDGSTVVNKKHSGLYSTLLKRSVFTASGKPVTEEALQSWPAPEQFRLWKASRILSGLDKKKAEAVVKND